MGQRISQFLKAPMSAENCPGRFPTHCSTEFSCRANTGAVTSTGLRVQRETMRLAKAAIDEPESARLAWILRCHADQRIVEEVLRLVLGYDEKAEGLGLGISVALADTAPLPESIDRFRIAGLLGAGSSSRVYRAIAHADGMVVALKVLTSRLHSAEVAARFEREIQTLARLRHPAIPRYIDSGSTAGDPCAVRWVAIELIEGTSFREAAKGQSQRWITEALVGICRAIQYAHGEGVVHRDLKPSNVLVDASSKPHVLDFGIASIRTTDKQERLTETGEIVGTVAYLSPEQVAGAQPDERSDQFSLAVMLFEALTGQLPHSDGRDGLLGLLSIADWDGLISPALTKEIDRPLGQVLFRALDIDPSLRYPSVAAFREDLERWLAGRRPQTAARGRLFRARRFLSRYRVPALATAATVTLLTIALVSTLMAWGEARAESERAQGLGNLALLPQLLTQENSLWPQTPANLPGMDAWLKRALALQGSLEASQEFAATELAQSSFERDAGRLPDAIRRVQERRSKAASVYDRTIGSMAQRWDEAAARVAEDLRMGALDLVPQLGLVPLGPDPESGFEEFALADWGRLPSRDPISRELLISDDFCPVLVLLPGGASVLGTPLISEESQTLPNGFELRFNDASFGTRQVELAPFLIGKYELTQGQWKRVMDANHSEWASGETNDGVFMTDRHPVEMMTYEEASTACLRMDCRLPTEAQWQFAAAPIERGLYWWPEETEWASPPENLLASQAPDLAIMYPWRESEFAQHAPVGMFSPNPHGLYDVLGNIQEWCIDDFKVHVLKDDSMPLEPGTGRVLADGGGDFSCRGGSFHTNFHRATLVDRFGPQGKIRFGTVGFRLAKTLELNGERRH